MTISRPTNIQKPFADAGAKNTIPVAATGTGKASFTDGFPPPTMRPITAGGIPPEGKDFNGILYDITSHTLWVNAGGQYQFDATLATAIGGYPAGMVIQDNAGVASYVSAVNNNTIDFNSTPSSIGSLWLPYAGTAYSNITIATTGGTTTLTAIQATARFITVTGTLIADANIVVPAALGRWTVINNTTGAFAVNVKTAAGTGVPIFQTKADTVFCDATNVDYDAHSSQTRTAGDSTKHVATTEFVTTAISGVKQPSTPWLTKKIITATGSFTVPAGVFTLRAYAFGKGGDAVSLNTKGGAGGGCAWGEIAVTPGQVIPTTIDSTQTLFGTYLTATAATGSTTAGTGSKDASVVNGGTASGGVCSTNGLGGASSGSPLGNGKGATVASYAGSSWGATAIAGDYAGCGIGGKSNGEYCGGPGGAATSTAMGPQLAYGAEFVDPLLAECNLRIPATYATGSTIVTVTNMPPGFGGNDLCKNGGLGSGGYGATALTTGSRAGDGGFGGGGGGAGTGTAGNGGFGGGGGCASGAGGTLGTGGPGAIVIFY